METVLDLGVEDDEKFVSSGVVADLHLLLVCLDDLPCSVESASEVSLSCYPPRIDQYSGIPES